MERLGNNSHITVDIYPTLLLTVPSYNQPFQVERDLDVYDANTIVEFDNAR